MTEEYRRGHAAGYANGIRDTQPNWIRADEKNPDTDGLYWVIGEYLHDRQGWKRGDCFIETNALRANGEWIDNLEMRKILYWAEEPIITPPRELMGQRIRKSDDRVTEQLFQEYPEAG